MKNNNIHEVDLNKYLPIKNNCQQIDFFSHPRRHVVIHSYLVKHTGLQYSYIPNSCSYNFKNTKF